jgi:hypothetical protein
MNNETCSPLGPTNAGSHPPSKLIAQSLFAAIVVMLLWASGSFFDYGEMFIKLSGKPLLERGYIGADQSQSFLARAGRLGVQRLFAKAEREGAWGDLQVGTAPAWVWIVETAAWLPPDAKIYLNVPLPLFYYYGTYFWFPRVLDVNTQPAIITGHTFRNNFQKVDLSQLEQLQRLGYTHVVSAADEKVRLIDIRSNAPEENR